MRFPNDRIEAFTKVSHQSTTSMSRPGPFKLMAKNWKKSIFYVGGFSTALWFTYDYTVTNDVMKDSCRKASAYGDERIKTPNSPIRHITVILNPVAGKRKSKKLYNKWVEPLFHLAGIKVSLVETESMNQAYDLMKIMSNCDGVAIVGGDGTVHEALNGLLSRPDCTKAVRDFPIGIIPTGQFNSIARYVHQNNMLYRNQKEFLIQATMRLVDSCTQKFDVLKIDPLVGERNQEEKVMMEQQNIDEQQQLSRTHSGSIYALRDIRYGIYQDNFYKVSGYRVYQNYIKPVWLRLQRAFSYNKYPPPKILSISYTEPCIGCSKCYNDHRLHDNQDFKTDEITANRRWWHSVVPVIKPTNPPQSDEEKNQLESSNRENPYCRRRINIGDVENVTDFRACMMGEKKVRLSLGRHREYSPSDITETKDIRLEVAKELDDAKVQSSQSEDEKSQASATSIGPSKEEQTKDDTKEEKKPEQFFIDGQPTQVHSVDITAINNAVTIFTGPYKVIISSSPDKKIKV